jgi:cell division protein FtsI/penicillin-binding protein 2
MRAAVEQLGRPCAGKARSACPPQASRHGRAGRSGRPDSWFIGFAPAGDPTIAVAVIIEGGGTGSEAAVPLGGQLMGAWLDLQH